MPNYYNHRSKCMECGLHFTVHSDFKDWPNKGTTRDQNLGEATGLIYCPECGSSSGKLLYVPTEESGFIFQVVPGPAMGVRSLGNSHPDAP